MEGFEHQFYCGIWADGWLYFSERNYNGLFRINFQVNKIEFVDFFMDENVNATGLHRMVHRVGNDLIFLPQWGCRIHVYNLESHVQKSMMLPADLKGKLVVDGGFCGNKMFLFPLRKKQPVLSLNLQDYSLCEEVDLSVKLGKYRNATKDFLFQRLVQDGTQIWAGVYGTNIILNVDLQTGNIQEYHTTIKDIYGVFYSSEGLWIDACGGRKIYRWTPEGISDEYGIDGPGLKEQYSQIVEVGNKVYVLPLRANKILYLDGGKLNEMEYPQGFAFSDDNAFKFFGFEIVDNGLWIFPFLGSGSLKACGDKLEYYPTAELKMNVQVLDRLKNKRIHQMEILSEDVSLSLADFLYHVKHGLLSGEHKCQP